MCGRFTLTDPEQDLAVQFNLPEIPDIKPRYNIAPTQPVAAIRRVPPAVADTRPSADDTSSPGDASSRNDVSLRNDNTVRELALLRWGLIPFWAKDPKIGARMINARSETVAEKPAFRAAFRRRRCLIAADGFYEWRKVEQGKQPYYIRLRERRPFAFAGLWEYWRGTDSPSEPSGKGTIIESCTLLTTEPNDLLRPLHNRMPVILHPRDYDFWLDPQVQDTEQLQSLLRAYPPEEMEAFPVSRLVNRPGNDDPRCIEPLTGGGYQQLQF